MNLSPNISKCWQPCKISSWVLGLQQSQKYSMDSGTDTQTKYSIYSDYSTAGAFLHFILKSNLLSPQCTPHHSHSNWGCPLRFWSTAILRALSVYWAVCVTIWTAFFWAVICITDQKKSPPQDFHTSAESEGHPLHVQDMSVSRIPCKKRYLHPQQCRCSF